ncbi:DNA polymerase III subunit alpha, partial [uncultured Stenotrophomonas sp.]|uniref:DNA polymerase III subunit alpha n=1 Tax=uncultured Stenotrophomonas sp. TaxID=165438 RepID=UPI0025D18DE4
MSNSRFVHLHVHTEFSLADSTIRVPAKPDQADPKKAKQANLLSRSVELGLPALAVTDLNNLFALVKFYKAAEGVGIKPIAGADVLIAEEGQDPWRMTLLCRDREGYLSLSRLLTRAWMEGHRPEGGVAVHPDWLKAGNTNLFALAGRQSLAGRLALDGKHELAEQQLADWQRVFGDGLHLELTRTGREGEETFNQFALMAAGQRGLPVVASNDVRFLSPSDFSAHEARVCISTGRVLDDPKRPREYSDQQYLKSAEEMCALFADIPDAIDNTLALAERCNIEMRLGTYFLPNYPVPDDETLDTWIQKMSRDGLEERLEKNPLAPGKTREEYFERLEFELNTIIKMGFPGYFLIVADFIQWGKNQGIPIGPGRGSGAGSLVAWALKITDLDPLPYNLLFERFLNPERVSMPDFDIDFCETRRGEVIRYVQEKYGRDQVAQIITFGKLKARAVLKDTGRVLQMSYGQVDRLAKLVPNHPTDPWDLKRALNGVPELAKEYANDNQVRRLLDLATKLEGLPRHSSTHAAGVVIGDRPLAQLVPLYRDPRSDMPVTQFDMKFVEGAGLVKFDFLGLKTLSVLQKAVQLLAKRGVEVDLGALAWDDEATYALLQKGDTVGVFQLESEGMRRTLSAVRPTNFGDIIALVSLYRPGPMDNIPSFGRRKQGTEEIIYPHPLLEQILSETYGIFVYQEQVMQAAQILAGYSLGGADLLRRAMGKKVKAEMDAQRAIFVKGCAEVNNIPAQKANELFDLIDKFAGYGFNKSHAAAYALLAYQTAWLKAHHPHEFYAASMCYDMALTDKLAIFVDDARRMGVTMLPPCINASQAEFDVEAHEDGLAVRYALGALKSVGEGAMEKLVVERQAGGAFASLDALAKRVDPRLMNKRQLETLASAGAFDGIEPNRAGVHAVAETVLAIAARTHEGRTSGQGGLFGETEVAGDAIKLPTGTRWTLSQRM